MKIMCASIETEISNCYANFQKISERVEEAKECKADMLVLPELCITGYSCGDMFYHPDLLCTALEVLEQMAELTRDTDLICLAGLPVSVNDRLYNCAAVLHNGHILGIVPKCYLANTGEYYEKRWFSSGWDCDAREIRLHGHTIPFGQLQCFADTESNLKFGVEICEDMWASISVSDLLTTAGVNLIVNLSASNETVHKEECRKDIIRNLSCKQKSIYVYCSGSMSESTTDVIYSEYKGIYSDGSPVCETHLTEQDIQTLIGDVDLEEILAKRRKAGINHGILPFFRGQVQQTMFSKRYYSEMSGIPIVREPFIGGLAPSVVAERTAYLQQNALLKKMQYTKRNKIVIGVSGGLDSTIALLSCVELFKREHMELKNIIGISMPGPGTTDRTHRNALLLMQALQITSLEISITDAVRQHLNNIGQKKGLYDITYEQTQSRERTKILMDLANKENALVIGTGDMSEFALGWMSYSGDQISMYALNCGIPKTVIIHMMHWYANNAEDSKIRNVLQDILSTPISPELLPLDENGMQKQSTEHLVGPYLLHDYFLYHFISDYSSITSLYKNACCTFPEYNSLDIKRWLRIFVMRFFTRQFKRSCFSDGIQVFDAGLSPRGYWRMPSDVSAEMLLQMIDKLDIQKPKENIK